MNALPFEIREEVIRQERQENEMRQSSRQRAPGNSQAPVTENKIDTKSISKSKVSAVNRDSIHLVEISGIASLLRLVFLPDSVNNTSLFNLLGNLCENSKSRNEILGLLLSVLSSGGADLASVDDMFSHLTLKTRKKTGASDRDTPIAASVPDLVAQRCLEVLIHLTRTVSVVGKYFLTESEAPLALKVKSKKGKTKLQTSSLVFPVVSLLNFLDQSRFLTNSTVLEQSMRLLSNVLRPLSLIAKKKFLNPDKANKTDLHESFIEEKLAVHGDKPEPQSSKDEKKEKNDIKLPSIPDSSVINAVTVLKDGISSSKSFQYALSTIQYLCSYPHHLNIITTQLLYFVQSLGDLITKELDQLLSDFKADTQPLNIGILEPFIIPTASQTKILRILKTIDYIYSKEGNFKLI